MSGGGPASGALAARGVAEGAAEATVTGAMAVADVSARAGSARTSVRPHAAPKSKTETIERARAWFTAARSLPCPQDAPERVAKEFEAGPFAPSSDESTLSRDALLGPYDTRGPAR